MRPEDDEVRRRPKKDGRGWRKVVEAGERQWRPEKAEEGRKRMDEAGVRLEEDG